MSRDLTGGLIDQAVLDRAARVIKVLGHPLRLRLLESLEGRERHVAELQDEVAASQAAVSQQLAILRAHGVVDARRDGPRVFYRIVEPKVSRILACIRECDVPPLPDGLPLVALATLGETEMLEPVPSESREGPLRTRRGGAAEGS